MFSFIKNIINLQKKMLLVQCAGGIASSIIAISLYNKSIPRPEIYMDTILYAHNQREVVKDPRSELKLFNNSIVPMFITKFSIINHWKPDKKITCFKDAIASDTSYYKFFNELGDYNTNNTQIIMLLGVQKMIILLEMTGIKSYESNLKI